MQKKTVALLLSLLVLVCLILIPATRNTTKQRGHASSNEETNSLAEGSSASKDTAASAPSASSAETHAQGDHRSDDLTGGSANTGEGSEAEAPRKGRIKLYGRVLTQDGIPVAGARVYLLPFAGAAKPPAPQQMTGGNGEYTFWGDLRGAYLLYAAKEPLISFSNRSELPRVIIGTEETDVGPMNLFLKPAQNITLQVRDHLSGKAIKGAYVRARGEMNLSFVTKENGNAGLTLSTGIWSLNISAAGYGSRSMALDLTGNQPQTIEVGLEYAGLVSGIVSNEEELVLEGIEVTCMAGGTQFKTKTDMDGYYFFDKVPLDGTFTLHMEGSGYREAYFNWQRFTLGKTSREVNASLTARPEPEDEDKLLIYGRVVDEEGVGIASAIAFLEGIQQEFPCDGHGFFQGSVSITRRMMLRVGAKAAGYAVDFAALITETSEENPVLLVLSRGRFLAGRVVDTAGAGIAGVNLKIQSDGGGGVGVFPVPGMDQIYTDNDGYFKLENLPNQIVIRAWAWGYAPLNQEFVALDREDALLTLNPMGAVVGHILDEEEIPLTEFTIKVASAGSEKSTYLDGAWTDPGIRFWSPDGSFALRGLSPGLSLKLTVQAPGYPPEVFLGIVAVPEEEAPSTDIILIQSGLQVAGTLRFASGEPAAGVRLQVLAYDAGDQLNSYFSWAGFFRGYYSSRALVSAWSVTDSSGAFAFDGLPADANLDLVVASGGIALGHMGNLEDKDEEALRNLSFTVATGGILDGSVDRVHFKTAKKVELTSLKNGDFNIPITLDDDSETFVVSQLPAGRYRLTLLGWVEASQPRKLGMMNITLAEGERRNIVLDEAMRQK